MTSDVEIRRSHLRADLETARQEFHDMVASISGSSWATPSHNSGWTNGQLLFHVLLGFVLVLPLAGLLVVFGHLPAVYSRIFAAILNFSTPLFNLVNAVGPRAGARLLGRAGLITKFDHVHGAILERLEHVRPSDWTLAMHYPTRWDERFKTPMRLEDLFRYPVDHLRHHRHQLRAA